MSAYTDNQRALAASPAGQIAVRMFPGTRWRTPGGAVAVVWMGWVPDVDGHAEAAAMQYRWPFSPDHNSEIGVTLAGRTERVSVSSVSDWMKAAA